MHTRPVPRKEYEVSYVSLPADRPDAGNAPPTRRACPKASSGWSCPSSPSRNPSPARTAPSAPAAWGGRKWKFAGLASADRAGAGRVFRSIGDRGGGMQPCALVPRVVVHPHMPEDDEEERDEDAQPDSHLLWPEPRVSQQVHENDT